MGCEEDNMPVKAVHKPVFLEKKLLCLMSKMPTGLSILYYCT